MKTAYLGLGSNLGNRQQYLENALCLLEDPLTIYRVACSHIYESKAVGGVEQGDFLNLVICIQTTLTPVELLERCLEIEAKMGRQRVLKWGPRIIDIDVLMYEDGIYKSAALELPHPRMLERLFVLLPLREIAPQLEISGESLQQHIDRLNAADIRQYA
jgi:2-amino-4-hydroxy-6-hydroxymethyldihydropteridine diphosphokinase